MEEAIGPVPTGTLTTFTAASPSSKGKERGFVDSGATGIENLPCPNSELTVLDSKFTDELIHVDRVLKCVAKLYYIS